MKIRKERNGLPDVKLISGDIDTALVTDLM